MPLDLTTIAATAQQIGIAVEDLAAIVQQGARATYGAGDYLYHESTPREWLGIVLEGEIEIIRGAQAHTTTLATFLPGAVFSEGVMLDDSPHASGAVTRQGTKVLQAAARLVRSLADGVTDREMPLENFQGQNQVLVNADDENAACRLDTFAALSRWLPILATADQAAA